MANELEQLEVLEAIDAGKAPDRKKLEANFSPDEQLKLLTTLEGKMKADSSALPPLTMMGAGGKPTELRLPEEEAALRAQGIETRPKTTAPAGARFRASFASSPKNEEEQIAAGLEAELGFRPEMRRVDGELSYLDPKTRRWTLADSAEPEMRDLASVGGLLPLIGSALPAPGALAGPETWPIVAAASGLAAGAGEVLRVGIGEFMGVNPELDASQYMAEGAGEALPTTIGGGIGGSGLRLINRLVQGPRIPPDEAAEILRQGKDAEDIVNILRTRGYDVKATPAQLADLKNLLNVEATVRAGLVTPSAAQDLLAREAKTQEEVARFFSDMLGPRGKIRSREALGQEMQQRAATAKAFGVLEPTAAAVRLRESIEAGLPGKALDEPLAGKQIKGGLERLLSSAEEVEDKAWRRVDELAGFDEMTATAQVKIPVDKEVLDSLSVLSKEADKALIGGEKAGKLSMLPTFKRKTKEIVNPFTGEKELRDAGYDDLDVSALGRTLSYLRTAERRIQGSTDPNLVVGRDIARIRKALEEARDRALAKSNPELLAAVKEAENATFQKYETYKRGIVGDILREGGMQNRQIFRDILRPNNGETAAEVATVLSGDAQAMSQARESIMSLYRREVMQDGKAVGKLHRKFMQDYKDTIDPFLTNTERKQLEVSGNLVEILEKTEQRLANRAAAFTKTLEGRLQRLNSESVTEAIFANSRTKGGSAFSVKDAEDFAKLFKNTPMEARVQEAVRDEVRRRVLTDGKFVSPNKLEALLSKSGDFDSEGKLRAIMGNQYVDDLKALRDTLQITSRKGEVIPPTSENQTLFGLYRTLVWPPLNHMGAVVRRVQNIALDSQRRAMAATLSDPDKLREIVKYGNMNIRNERVAALLASIGVTATGE